MKPSTNGLLGTNLPDSGRKVGNPETTGNLQTFMAAYAEGSSNSKLNDTTNKFGSLRPPQPHASGAARADGALTRWQNEESPFRRACLRVTEIRRPERSRSRRLPG